MEKLYVEVPRDSGVGSTLREATEQEQEVAWIRRQKIADLSKQIDRLLEERKALYEGCDHKVIFDGPGFAYNLRTCGGCGSSLGLV